MGNTLPHPRTEKELEEGAFGVSFTYGVADMQGWRLTMEDAYTVAPNFSADYDDTHFIGIFDGHGGSEVAKFCAHHFHEQLKNLETFDKSDFSTALKECFHLMDSMLQRPEHSEEITDHRADALQHQFKVISDLIIEKKTNKFTLAQLQECLNLANHFNVTLIIKPDLVKALEKLYSEGEEQQKEEEAKKAKKKEGKKKGPKPPKAPVAPTMPEMPSENLKKGKSEPSMTKKSPFPSFFSASPLGRKKKNDDKNNAGGSPKKKTQNFFMDDAEDNNPFGPKQKTGLPPGLDIPEEKNAELSNNTVANVFLSDDEDDVPTENPIASKKDKPEEHTSVLELKKEEEIILPTKDNMKTLRNSLTLNRNKSMNAAQATSPPVELQNLDEDNWSDEEFVGTGGGDPKKTTKKKRKKTRRKLKRSRTGTSETTESGWSDTESPSNEAEKLTEMVRHSPNAGNKMFSPSGPKKPDSKPPGLSVMAPSTPKTPKKEVKSNPFPPTAPINAEKKEIKTLKPPTRTPVPPIASQKSQIKEEKPSPKSPIGKRKSFYEETNKEYMNLEEKRSTEKSQRLSPIVVEASEPEAQVPETIPEGPTLPPGTTEDMKFVTDAGCTAVSALFYRDKLFVANVGDSRAVMSRAGVAKALSEDHKPTLPKERARIYKAGGTINAQGRINGDLNLSRCVGDLRFKMQKNLSPAEQIITAEPDVREFTMTPNDQFVVFACDGIWDVKSNQEVVSFVLKKIKDGETSLAKIAGDLLDACISKDLVETKGLGGDNMTCIIVALQPLATIKAFKTGGLQKTMRRLFMSSDHRGI